MIEDIIAQAHGLVDTLTFQSGSVALSALQTLSANRRHISPFASLLGIEVEYASKGQAEAVLEVKPHHLNSVGIAHGAVPYALADTAAGGAVYSSLEDQIAVTQDIQYQYRGPAKYGLIRAKARVLQAGSRTIRVQVTVEQNDTRIGNATATFAVLKQDALSQIKQQ